ncbi:acyl-CoA dehydrogenase family protein [Curtobacterium sp. NPDC090217]|uniref:acyl-CoA dehydrogenase family protein n=1 Tax=Curtobacterium sp. NPDC090217 TaxID=3363970 RepID=UPI003828FAF8
MTTLRTTPRSAQDGAVRSSVVTALKQVLPVVSEQKRSVDASGSFPTKAVQALRDSGLMGLVVPTELGGMGGNLKDVSFAARALAGECMTTAVLWSMHCQQVLTVAVHGGDLLRERVLPAIARGEKYVGSITTERGSGGHLLHASAPLLRPENGDSGGYRLRRDAPVSSGALHADAFLITMRAGEEASPDQVRLVWAERADVEVVQRSVWDPMGMRGTESVGVQLDGTVDADAVIDGDFRAVALQTFIPAGHVAWASSWLGAAQGALRRAVDIFRDPKQRAQYEVTSDRFAGRLARIRLELDMTEAFLDRTLGDLEEFCGPNASRDVSEPAFQIELNNLKVVAAERTFAAVNELIELVGLRHGYLNSSPTRLEQVARDLRSASLMYADERLLLANGKLALLDRNSTLP